MIYNKPLNICAKILVAENIIQPSRETEFPFEGTIKTITNDAYLDQAIRIGATLQKTLREDLTKPLRTYTDVFAW